LLWSQLELLLSYIAGGGFKPHDDGVRRPPPNRLSSHTYNILFIFIF
jgi:hypothetical protein